MTELGVADAVVVVVAVVAVATTKVVAGVVAEATPAGAAPAATPRLLPSHRDGCILNRVVALRVETETRRTYWIT
jgi:hypothetical protein